LYSDFPDRFNALGKVCLEFKDGRRQWFNIQETWKHKGRRVFKLAGIDTIDSSEQLVGCWVEVPAEQAVPLPEGTYFDHDLVGCRVVDVQNNDLGTVTDILRIAGNNQLVVRGPAGEYLVPVTQSICTRICVEDKVIVADLPEGLMDLGK